jgi:hypothetical protein
LLPASIPAADLVGRWGLAAYHKEEDRSRTGCADFPLKVMRVRVAEPPALVDRFSRTVAAPNDRVQANGIRSLRLRQSNADDFPLGE